MRTPIILGLTGPTGAGKSTVASCFSSCGCLVIDCDRLAREVTDTGCLSELTEAFGAEILDENGCLNRKALAQKAFSDPAKTALLNEITHPAIRRKLLEKIQAARGQYPAVVIDAPLLFEAGVDRLCDKILAVIAPPEERLRRIMLRDGIEEPLARMRMCRQHEDAFYTSRADVVLDGTAVDTEAQVRAILKNWTGDLF